MIGVVTHLIRGTCLIPPHIREDNEVLRLLPWAHTLRLECFKHKVHCLLEVRARALTTSTCRNGLNPCEQVRARRKVVPGRIRVEGHQLILELIRADGAAEDAERH